MVGIRQAHWLEPAFAVDKTDPLHPQGLGLLSGGRGYLWSLDAALSKLDGRSLEPSAGRSPSCSTILVFKTVENFDSKVITH